MKKKKIGKKKTEVRPQEKIEATRRKRREGQDTRRYEEKDKINKINKTIT